MLVDVEVFVVGRVLVVEAVLVVLKENEVDLDVLPCANATGVDTKHRILAQVAVFMTAVGQKGRSHQRSVHSFSLAHYKCKSRCSA